MTSALLHNAVAPQRLLVTGAGGFVGSHVVSAIRRIRPKTEIVACDVLPREAGVLELDVRDRGACERVMREVRPTHVLHAAAVTHGSERDILTVNVRGTENLFEVASKTEGVVRCVLLSSSAVYGATGRAGRCDEAQPLQLHNDYARSKRVAELCLPELERRSGVQMVAGRVGPCYGPAEQPGVFRPRVSLVGTLLEALREDRLLCVAGEDYVRDWTHLDQIAEALWLLLRAPLLRHRIYNVSAGYAVSSREMIEVFCRFGLRVQRTEDASEAALVLRAEDGRTPLAIDRLRQDTGFAPSSDWRPQMASLLAHRELHSPIAI